MGELKNRRIFKALMTCTGMTKSQLLDAILDDWLESSGVEVLKGRVEGW